MLKQEERQAFIKEGNYFLDMFVRKQSMNEDFFNSFRDKVRYNLDDPLVIDFVQKLVDICLKIIHSDQVTRAFYDKTPYNYKEQKIAQAYHDIIHPYEQILNTFIVCASYGRSSSLKKLKTLSDMVHISFDDPLFEAICGLYDNTNKSYAKNFTADRNHYLSLEEEIKEYELASRNELRSPRFEKYKRGLEQQASDEGWEYGMVSPEHEFQKQILGNIGEIITADSLCTTPFFIFTSRDVGNFMGFDMSNSTDKENLIEVKTTWNKSDKSGDVFFVGPTEIERIQRSLEFEQDVRNEQYYIYRLFLGHNFRPEDSTYLKPIDQYTFRSDDNITYECTDEDRGRRKYKRK